MAAETIRDETFCRNVLTGTHISSALRLKQFDNVKCLEIVENQNQYTSRQCQY